MRDDQLEGLALLSRFPAAFRPPALASWSSCSRRGVGRPLGSAYRPRPDPDGISVFRTHEQTERAGTPRTGVPRGDAWPRPRLSRAPALWLASEGYVEPVVHSLLEQRSSHRLAVQASSLGVGEWGE
jgi:hypothetical protein